MKLKTKTMQTIQANNYKIVLYNKTFTRDFKRTKRLLESINEFNIEILFWILYETF